MLIFTTANVGQRDQSLIAFADNLRGALEAIDRNEEFIKMTLAVMMTGETSIGRLNELNSECIHRTKRRLTGH